MVLGNSVIGATHKRSDKKENQDAIAWSPRSDNIVVDQPIILAIADGHGSSRHYRSKRGAEIAVNVVVSILQKFFDQEINNSNISSIKNMAYDMLPKIISRSWEDKVLEDIKTNPINQYEKEKFATNNIDLEAYGTTLLIVAIKDSFIFFIQIGDGDILLVDTAGNTKNPIARDENILTNETSSLCMKNNWKEFRLTIQQYTENSLPALILLSTDGYSNSFGDNSKFQWIGRDYLKDITNIFSTGDSMLDKKKSFSDRIKKILEETTEKGSGDDISLGMIVNLSSLSFKDNVFKLSKNGKDKLLSILEKNAKDGKQQKQIEEIIQDYFNPALKMNTNLPDVWYNKGYALFNLSRYEEAVDCFNKALILDPQSADSLNNIGLCYNKLGNYDKAVEYFDKALKLDSNYVAALKNKEISKKMSSS